MRRGKRVCAIFYGHPGVFAFPPHEVIRRARAEGFEARMLPGISAIACLFADVGVEDVRQSALWSVEGLRVLVEVLLESYPAAHEVVVYEASTLPIVPPKILRVPLSSLPGADVTAISTLYVPPLPDRASDDEILRRLGLAS